MHIETAAKIAAVLAITVDDLYRRDPRAAPYREDAAIAKIAAIMREVRDI